MRSIGQIVFAWVSLSESLRAGSDVMMMMFLMRKRRGSGIWAVHQGLWAQP